jgi:hypothetical protein
MKTSKLIAGGLVMLGFAACKPDEAEKPMYGPPHVNMYGAPSAQFEQKPQVPDAGTTAEFKIEEQPEQQNENE